MPRPAIRFRSNPGLCRTRVRCSGRVRKPAEPGRRRSTASRALEVLLGVGRPFWLLWSCVRPQLSPTRMGHRRGCAQKFAVPGEGAIKAGVERELRPPVEHGAGAFSAQILMTNFVARLVEHFRAQRGLHFPQNCVNKFQYADLAFIGKIKSLAAKCRIRGETLSQQHVCGSAIFDIEIVADEMTV